jgi:hypothetical protein
MINEQPSNSATGVRNDQAHIMGQKYAYATASLLAGIATCIHLLGIEKAVLTIVLAWLALKAKPYPRLQDRRLWAKTAFVLGLIYLVVTPVIVIWKFEFFRQLIDLLEKLQ